MDAIVAKYDVNFEEFKTVVGSASALVAGSTALAGYLEQESIIPGFTPTDMDIFYPDGAWGNDEIDLHNIIDLFLAAGFSLSDKFADTGYESFVSISSVISLIKGDKEIQIIVIDCYDLVAYMKYNFDLSVCISWWDSKTNRFETASPYLTKLKQMFTVHKVIQSAELSMKRDARIQKYMARGFTLIESPCPIRLTRDSRAELVSDKFKEVIVSDIISLEDIPFTTFLTASDYNIVIKAGERFYAFDRRVLTDYMLRKKTYISDIIGYVYETPLNQCISQSGLSKITLADYSIFKLCSDYSVASTKGVKSIFNIHCYSVKQWIEEDK